VAWLVSVIVPVAPYVAAAAAVVAPTLRVELSPRIATLTMENINSAAAFLAEFYAALIIFLFFSAALMVSYS